MPTPEQPSMRPRPGWYPDPADPSRVRYYDGVQWSAATAQWPAAKGPGRPAAQPATQRAAQPSRRRRPSLRVIGAAAAALLVLLVVVAVATSGAKKQAGARLSPADTYLASVRHDARGPALMGASDVELAALGQSICQQLDAGATAAAVDTTVLGSRSPAGLTAQDGATTVADAARVLCPAHAQAVRSWNGTAAVPVAKAAPVATAPPTTAPPPPTTAAPVTELPVTIPPATVAVSPVTTAPSTGGTGDPNLSNDNSYVNSSGNTVHSPAASTNGQVPAGATAQCVDGTYSFSQHRSGTCSHHGGVAQWLTP